jgi:hypothetical protein
MRWWGWMPARAIRRAKAAWYGASEEEGVVEAEAEEQRHRRRRRSGRRGDGEGRRESSRSAIAGVGGDNDYGMALHGIHFAFVRTDLYSNF